MNRILKDYWFAVLRKLPLLLVASFVLALVAYGAARRLGPTYEVHYSYLISLSAREQPKEYTFDGYYALQATDLFTATLAKWATAPEMIVEAYKTSHLKMLSSDPRVLAHTITAEKTAPQLVQITVKDSDKGKAEELAHGLKAVIQKNVDIYHAEGIPALTFRVVATEPWTGVSQLNTAVIAAATFIISLLLGINVVVFVKSFEE